MLEIYTYNAGKGDCIRLHFAEIHNIFIDSGVIRFAPKFKKLCDEIIQKGETLDALILTHVDDDHIGGVLGNLRYAAYQCPFCEVWMNYFGNAAGGDRTLSVRQNDEVYARLIKQGIPVRTAYKGEQRELEGALIHVFWPERTEIERYNFTDGYNEAQLSFHSDYCRSLSELAEMPLPPHDASKSNRQSILFSFKFENHSILFTGDAWAENVIEAKGTYDLIKISHHGSARNLSENYPDTIQSSNFLICTDGRMHPDKQTIAKLEKWYGEINIFSPSSWWNSEFFTEEDRQHSINYYKKEGLVIAW